MQFTLPMKQENGSDAESGAEKKAPMQKPLQK